MTEAKFPAKLKGLFNDHRYKIIYGGRGSGKSWGVARYLLISAASQSMRVLCTREVQKSLRQSVHQLLTDQIAALGLTHFYTVLETEIRGINGSLFIFAGLSTQTADSIKSLEGVDKVWIEEGSSITKRSLDILTPTIRKPGSEIIITFNPDLDTDEVYQRYVINTPPDSWLMHINYSDNPWLSKELEDERQHCLRSDPKSHDHIWLGKPKSVVDGAIFADEFQTMMEEHRITKVSHDPMLKTHVIFDLGFRDSMAIIMAQRSGSELRIIDYIEDSYRTLDHYSNELRSKAYNWGTVFMPHDAVARDFKTGKSAAEIMESFGWMVSIVPMGEVENGLRIVRMTFPRIWMDKEKTARLQECMKRYRRQISTTTQIIGNPLHDEYSHGADAFRYMCVAADQMKNDNIKRKRDNTESRASSWMSA